MKKKEEEGDPESTGEPVRSLVYAYGFTQERSGLFDSEHEIAQWVLFLLQGLNTRKRRRRGRYWAHINLSLKWSNFQHTQFIVVLGLLVPKDGREAEGGGGEIPAPSGGAKKSHDHTLPIVILSQSHFSIKHPAPCPLSFLAGPPSRFYPDTNTYTHRLSH